MWGAGTRSWGAGALVTVGGSSNFLVGCSWGDGTRSWGAGTLVTGIVAVGAATLGSRLVFTST